MRDQRARMAKDRGNCRQECLEIQRSGDQEIQDIHRVLREDVEAVQKQIDQKMRETQHAVDGCVERRQRVAAETERQINEAVDTKVHQGLAVVQMQVLEAREVSFGHIKEVQARDFEQEKLLRERIGAALVSVDCSMQERDQVAMMERSFKKQIATATDILGCSPSSNRVADNRRLRTAGASAIGAA